ncbi:MAG TPA: hypothetical protein VI911_08870 [Patescibacteria group bacterium]|nr:MAG: hypothetical protein UR43_C0005G0058 [candidate division TM6 bacterium GW2011_GWF2_33_332]HLD91109.1 hypothetical protein [Patescibacteria group bacterium]
MSKIVYINNKTYNLPLQGENAPWGEEQADIINAIIDALNTLQGPDDIIETSETILNTSGAKEIITFHFNSSTVRSFEAPYNISRRITKEITSYTGNGVTTIVVLSYNHNLNNGDTVTITDTSNIDSTFVITRINATSFSILSTFNGSDVGGKFDIELVESGVLSGNYSLQGWVLAQRRLGDAKVEFDINSSGTITYNPEVLSGEVGSHASLLKFFAKSIISV